MRTLSIIVVSCLICGCIARSLQDFTQSAIAPQYLRVWPPTDLKIEECPANSKIYYIQYTGRYGEEIKILTNQQEVVFNFGHDLTAATERDAAARNIDIQFLGITAGSPADVSIHNGWLYLVGKKASVGTETIVGAAESSKLIVDCGDPKSNPPKPQRILHPGATGDAKCQVWYVGDVASKKDLNFDKEAISRSPNAIEIPAGTIDANDPIVEAVTAAVSHCKDEQGNPRMDPP